MNKMEQRLHRVVKMQSNERSVLVVRKHWFIFLKEVFGVALGTIAVWTVLGVFIKVSSFPAEVLVFWQALSILLGILTAFVIWTNYFLDMWVVTNKRILHVDQIKLFSRMVAATRIDRVQDVKAKVSGFIPTILGYGNLQVQTAGTQTTQMLIQGIPNPNQVRQVILKYMDKAIDSAHNKDGVGHS